MNQIKCQSVDNMSRRPQLGRDRTKPHFGGVRKFRYTMDEAKFAHPSYIRSCRIKEQGAVILQSSSSDVLPLSHPLKGATRTANPSSARAARQIVANPKSLHAADGRRGKIANGDRGRGLYPLLSEYQTVLSPLSSPPKLLPHPISANAVAWRFRASGGVFWVLARGVDCTFPCGIA